MDDTHCVKLTTVAMRRLAGFSYEQRSLAERMLLSLLEQEKTGGTRNPFEHPLIPPEFLKESFQYRRFGVVILYSVDKNVISIDFIDFDPPPSGGRPKRGGKRAVSSTAFADVIAVSNIRLPDAPPFDGGEDFDPEPRCTFLGAKFNGSYVSDIVGTRATRGTFADFGGSCMNHDSVRAYFATEAAGGRQAMFGAPGHNMAIALDRAVCRGGFGIATFSGSVAAPITDGSHRGFIIADGRDDTVGGLRDDTGVMTIALDRAVFSDGSGTVTFGGSDGIARCGTIANGVCNSDGVLCDDAGAMAVNLDRAMFSGGSGIAAFGGCVGQVQ